MSSEQFGQLRKFKLVFLGEQSGNYKYFFKCLNEFE